jgi:putative ABC transport system permease protein
MRRDPLILRVCLSLLRAFAILVPRATRDGWRREWDAEVRHRWRTLVQRQDLHWRSQMDLVRRVFGALPDAAWLRRQFTFDADIVHDVRHGLRMLRKSPTFTGATVLIIALGIAGTVAIATLLDTLLFRPLPYAEADRVVTLWQQHTARGFAREDVAPANFVDWRQRARSFSAMAAVIPYSHDFTGGGEPEVFFGAQVTDGFWDALGIRPALGRPFLPEEHVPGGRRAVIISHGLWKRKFGGDPFILDRAISLDGEPWTVVGVLPREFAPQLLPRPGQLEIWTPKVIQDQDARTRGSAWWNVVARLAPGVTVQDAQHEMEVISALLSREYPRTNTGLRVEVVPLRDHLMGGLKRPLFILLAAVVLVLGIGCVNVASLLLARGMERDREFAIRAALGAGRARLVRQLLTESLLLSLLASGVGVAAAHWVIRIIVALAPGGVARLHDAAIDGRALVFATLLTLVTALTFGAMPAIQLSRPRRRFVRDRTHTDARRLLRQGLVTAEVAVALMLLIGAGLLLRSFSRLLAVDPGFSSRNAVAVQVFAWDRNGTAERIRQFFASTVDRMRTIPGVESVGAVSAMPFMIANIDIRSSLAVVGRETGSDTDRSGAYLTIVVPGYFETMGIPLREGRYIESDDTEHTPRVAVISEALRRREWPSGSPLGARIRFDWQGQRGEAEIIGVVSQIRHEGLDGPARAEVFLPLPQFPFASMTYVLRGNLAPAALINGAKREVWAVDPQQTFYDASSVSDLVSASIVRQRFSVTLLSALAALALVLCAAGVYAIVSMTTLQRTREIGVRMALGADGRAIRAMLLREGLLLIGGGIGLGLAGASAVVPFLQALLFEIRPSDPVTFVCVTLLLAAVGAAACYLPARRATHVDPLLALRTD